MKLTKILSVNAIVLSVLLLCAPFTIMAKSKPIVWDNPLAEGEYVSGIYPISITITRVEFGDSETIVNLSLESRASTGLQFAKDIYLRVGGTKYTLTGAEGIELGKVFKMSANGKCDIVFHFPAIPADTK